MNYYKDENGKVFAYDDEQLELGYGSDMTPMTDAEIDAHLNPEPEELTTEQTEVARQLAYADPIKGSDRYFAEATRMRAMGEDGWEAVREHGIERYKEIQTEYPWP